MFNFDPPATNVEIRAASLQFVRKITGFSHPSKVNEDRFKAAVDEIAVASARLLTSLESRAPLRSRAEETLKAKVRSAKRFPKTTA